MNSFNRSFLKYFGTALLFLTVIFLTIELPLYSRLLGSFEDGVPALSGAYAARSLFFAFASAVLVFLIYLRASQQSRLSIASQKREQTWSKAQKLGAIAMLVAATLPLGLLVFKPGKFFQLSREDVLIEPLSALLFSLTAIVLIWQAWKLREKQIPNKQLIAGGCYLLAVIFFVISMEEVSWFQRIADVETPEAFAANAQSEMNIHNFATNTFEHIYYSGSFLYLIALPFLQLVSALPKQLKGLEAFTGNSFTLCLSSIFVACNYDMWNAFSIQIPFFLTFFMLLSLGIMNPEASVKKIFLAFAMALLLIQTTFFLWGSNMTNIAAATEYKEFFIAIGFFIHSLSGRQNLLRSFGMHPLAVSELKVNSKELNGLK